MCVSREIENHRDILKVVNYFPQKNEFFKPFLLETECPHNYTQTQTQADKYRRHNNVEIDTCLLASP